MINRLRAPIRSLLHSTLGGRGVAAVQSVYDDSVGRVHYALSKSGRESRRALAKLKDVYRGERCFIIGNGPSLNLMDLSFLRHEYTFGLNRIYLMYKELGFSTTFLVCVNPFVIEQCAEELASQPTKTFVTWQHRRFLPADAEVAYLRCIHRPGFYSAPENGLWQGATVTYVAMQLAFHMGFEEVNLIGVDHSFVTTGKPGKLVSLPGDDPNHFSGAYFGKGFRWQLPDLEMSEIAYQMARDHFEAAGRTIYDATVGGKLTIFPKRSYDAIFQAGRRSA